MTDRTFRDPSPVRDSAPAFYDQDAPPVPAVPQRYMSPPPVPAKSIRRPASVEPPERVLSPPPRPNGRGVSLDRGPGLQTGKPKGAAAKTAGHLKSVGEVDRSQPRDPVNFSRPMSPTSSPAGSPIVERRVASPPPQTANTQRSDIAANVGRLRDVEAENIQYSLQETARAPVKKKKKILANTNAAGSHLAAGTSTGRVSGTSVQSTPQRQPPSLNSTPSPASQKAPHVHPDDGSKPILKKKKKKVATSDNTNDRDSDVAYASDSDSAVSDRSNMSDRARIYNTRAAGLLLKQPSIVREDREGEEMAESSSRKANRGQTTANGNVDVGAAKLPVKTLPNGQVQSQRNNQKPTTTPVTKATSLNIPRALSPENGSASISAEKGTNRQSLSPIRAAHFSSKPIYETPDGVKHQPPARSVSPAKSALKHSPSRGVSPIAGMPVELTRRRGPASEASDTTSIISEDGLKSLPKQKKSVRVSFDDESIVVGRAATPPTDPDSPTVMSPQNKGASGKRWLPFGKDKKQYAPNSGRVEDTVMQPTPVLPSFGSVRGRNGQEEQTSDAERKDKPILAGSPGISGSSDERVGGIISRIFGADETGVSSGPAGIRASADPLPPEVTSVEGSGYHSDDEGSELDKEDDTVDINTTPRVEKNELTEEQEEAPMPISEPVTESLQLEEPAVPVPFIAVQPATPRPEQGNTFEVHSETKEQGEGSPAAAQTAVPATEEKQSSKDDYWVYLPGGFPVLLETTNNDQPSPNSAIEHHSTVSSPGELGTNKFETSSTAANRDRTFPVVDNVAEEPFSLLSKTEPGANEESDDSNNSIYSDAAEDMSDIEGDGFGSINAIVKSPAASPQVNLRKQNVPESPIERGSNDSNIRPTQFTQNESELSEPGPDAGWEKAQRYWSGLSQQRKQQIEQAATTRETLGKETAEEAAPKPKKKKIVAKKSAQPEARATEQAQPPLPPWPDRQYREDIAKNPPQKTPAIKKARQPLQSQASQAPPTAMKKSMRGPQNIPPQEPTMRSSMRNSLAPKPPNRMSSPPGTLPEPRGPLQKKQRPMSAVGISGYKKPQGSSAVNHDRAVSLDGPSKAATSLAASMAKTKAPVSKPLRRNDSDSSSSFKRARTKSPDGGRYTMKRSMRGSSMDERPQSTHDRSVSLTNRTTSPTGSARRPFSTAGPVGPTMRTSMRASMDSGKRARSPSRSFGFGKSKAKAAPADSKSRFSSRFGDSSDEEEGPVSRRSRFVDSSDEDEPVDFTPVRGIPRRIDEGDSTDLEDSSDEKIVPKAAALQLQAPKPEGRALGAGSLRPLPNNNTASPAGPLGSAQPAKEKEKKKRSFFGGLGSKKAPKAEPAPIPPTNSLPKQDILTTPKANKTLGSPAPGSPAQPVSPMNLNIPASPQSKKSPKLQRRISAQQAEKIQMKRGMSDSWPPQLSPGGTSTPNARPSTSDGTTPNKKGPLGASGLGREVIPQEGRPGLGPRNETADAYQTGAAAVAAVGEKKKKGWLRKAFGR